jgi:hypothetical protein
MQDRERNKTGRWSATYKWSAGRWMAHYVAHWPADTSFCIKYSKSFIESIADKDLIRVSKYLQGSVTLTELEYDSQNDSKSVDGSELQQILNLLLNILLWHIFYKV